MDGFVGRVAELRVMAAAFEQARQGAGRFVTVAGPAGVGKTRFCAEVTDRARAAGFVVVWGRCWTGGGAPALWPWQPVLAELCGTDAAALLDGDVDTQRFSRFVRVGERLAAACAGRPAVLVLDDVHAADPAALLLTRFVARSLHRLPLVLVATHRPSPALSDLTREGLPVVLGAFTPAETREFLAGAGNAAELHAVSRGSPLVLRRLLAHAGRALPDGLAGMIDEPARHLLATTAVLGNTVPVADAVRITGVAESAVLDSVRAAEGLVDLVGTELTFSHDLVRQAFVDTLTPGSLLDAHANAAEISRGQPARRAHHAVAAAPRSAADARVAVDACRAAAGAHHLAYEQAAALLSTAVDLYGTAGLGPVPARLLLDLAHAVHRCGRLTETRPLFDRAAAAARAEHDPVLFAEAALGGMWGNDRRDRIQRAHVVALQREALAHLPAGETLLRSRLTARLAAEPDDVLAALESARGTGDPRVLAEALSLCHHALLAPAHAATRLAIADELIAVAAAAGLEVAVLVSVCWRTVDLCHLGDPRAQRSLAELRQRSELLVCQSVRYVQAAVEVMLSIRAGDLAGAEEQAERCLRLGVEAGDPDARHCHGAQLMAVGWLRGHAAELLDLAERTACLPTLPDGELVFHATLALLAAEAGQHDRARAALHHVTANGLAAIPPTSTWLGCLFAVVETAATLGEPDLARQAYELLVPFADRPVMPSMAVVCFGSTERTLGLAALTFGDTETAVAHLERAVAANIRLANRPLTAVARADLAEALRRRGDLTRATELLDLAVTAATEMGMTARAATWKSRRAMALHRTGDHWLIIHNGRTSRIDDLVGVRYLARLLARPGTEITALDMTGADRLTEPANHAVLDGPARAAYARRARELAEEITAARRDADLARVTRLELELEALTAEIERGTGINGRPRHFTGPAERARTAVRKAITRAIDAIATTDPEAADTLRTTVTTGYHCVYRPR